MKGLKSKYLLFIFLILTFFSIRNVYAKDNSSLMKIDSGFSSIMLDSNTTCKNYLEGINYDLNSVVPITFSAKDYIISLGNSAYISGASFTFDYYITKIESVNPFLYYNPNKDSVDLYFNSVNRISHYTFFVDCSSGSITYDKNDNGEPVFESFSSRTISNDSAYTTEVYDNYVYNSPISFTIFERISDDNGTDWYFNNNYFQSNLGSLFYRNKDLRISHYKDFYLNEKFYFDGILNNSGVQIDLPFGGDYYKHHYILAAGSFLLPFRDTILGVLEPPYRDNYKSISLSSGVGYYFQTITDFTDGENYDTNLYVKPISFTNDSDNTYTTLYIKSSYYQDMSKNENPITYKQNMGDCLSDSEFCNPYATKHITGIDQGIYLYKGKLSGISNDFIVYYDSNVYDVSYVMTNGQAQITQNSKGEDVYFDSNSLNKAPVNADGNNPSSGGSIGVNGSWLSNLLSGVTSISDFLKSVMTGISALTDSVGVIITTSFTFIGKLPTEVSSVMYLSFLILGITMILKIVLGR